jgi:hypothetical protein
MITLILLHWILAMNKDLMIELRSQFASGLIRKASMDCPRWAQNYVVLGKPKPGPMSFKWHPWEKEMMACDSNWSGRKAAQMGYTNVALIRGIFTNDIKKNDVLYLLPKRSPDATDFSKAKFDSLLELSPALNNFYSNAKNVGHKQAGGINFYIRGARSRSGLKSISVGQQTWDELDEMPKSQMALATERSSGYDEKDIQRIKISTPTVPDFGIDEEIKTTDKSIWVFRCPSCSRWTNLPFPDCLYIASDSLQNEALLKESYIFCPLCKNKLHHETKHEWLGLEAGAHWEKQDSKFSTRGFLINQYYSTTIEPWKIAESYIKGLSDPSALQEYWNSKGGLPHVPEGARVNPNDFKFGDYSNNDRPNTQGQLITMGIDVGSRVLHFWIDQWFLPPAIGAELNMFAKCKNLRHGTCKWTDLQNLMRDYQVIHAVIDYQPETTKSLEFCIRFAGHAHMCYPNRGAIGKAIKKNDPEYRVGVGRTAWLDIALGRFKNATILMPRDTLEDAKKQIMNLIRITKKDQDDQPIARYISVGPEHFGMARYYSEIALPLAVAGQRNQNITDFL